MAEQKPEPVRRLPRAQRREQILAAAPEAFARVPRTHGRTDSMTSTVKLTIRLAGEHVTRRRLKAGTVAREPAGGRAA